MYLIWKNFQIKRLIIIYIIKLEVCIKNKGEINMLKGSTKVTALMVIATSII